MKQKRFVMAICMALVLALLAGCTASAPQATQTAKAKVNLAALNGPTGIGMVKLWDEDNKNTAKNDYNFTFTGTPDEIVSKISSGEVDIAAVPINLAGTLYNKTNGNVQIMAVITGGVLYVLENGDTVKTVADLKGKTILATGQGSTPEFVLNYLLEQNGVKNATVEYKAEHAELATLMVSGQAKLAMLPEPFVTTVLSKNANVHIALDLNDEWQKTTKAKGQETSLSMSALVVRKDFASKNAEAVKTFLSEYEASVNYVNANVKDAAALVKQAGIMADAALAEKAIPNCNIMFMTGDTLKTTVTKLYEVFFAANPKSIGGSMPKDDFFYAAQ